MSISRKTSNYCNNAKLSVGRENGSVLPFSYTNADFSIRMGKRFSLACFDITMQNPTFEWATVLHFFVDVIKQSSLLGSKNWLQVQNKGCSNACDGQLVDCFFFVLVLLKTESAYNHQL